MIAAIRRKFHARPRREPVLIVAGSAEQARFWARELGFERNEYVYVTPQSVHGRREPTVYLVGTWRARPDIQSIFDALAPASPTIIDGEGMVRP